MSVSIAAGPAVAVLLDTIGVSRTGLLTSMRAEASGGLTIFQLPPGSDPNRIVREIRGIADRQAVDHLIIECEPDRPPMAYASLFVAAGDAPHGLDDVSRLTGNAFAIQPTALLDTLLGREPESLPGCFTAEQIEFVSDIFLEGEHEFDLARSIALALNPRARISPLGPDAVEKWLDSRGSSFDFDAALNGAGWRQLLDTDQPTLIPDKRITAFSYHARRPFHPERFANLSQQNLPGVFRAKGFFWLATRMDEVGGLNLAGADFHVASAGTWWAARDQTTRESEMPERTRAEWQEPHGDRRQSFAIMALDIDRATLQSRFDACLLTDAEMAGDPGTWKNFADPFPSWSHAHAHPHDHDHECDHDHHHHDHGSGEHDCCHH